MTSSELQEMIKGLKEYLAQEQIWKLILSGSTQPTDTPKYPKGAAVSLTTSDALFVVKDSCTVNGCNVYYLALKNNDIYEIFTPEIMLK